MKFYHHRVPSGWPPVFNFKSDGFFRYVHDRERVVWTSLKPGIKRVILDLGEFVGQSWDEVAEKIRETTPNEWFDDEDDEGSLGISTRSPSLTAASSSNILRL